MARELVGEIGVDSGQVFIVDPCYLNDPLRWNPKKMLQFAKEHEKKGEDRMAANSYRLAKEKTELQNLIKDWSAVCKDSEQAKHEPRMYASGIISPTRHGDGGFPVYVHRDDEGRVKKMEIIF